MDGKLIAWARAVKARQPPGRLPPLWLFTDSTRLADPLAAVARLPAGLCGVVLRDDARPDRAALIARLARLCRQRRLALVLAGAAPGPAGTGQHWSAGRRPGHRAGGPTTASAHTAAELHRARRAGATLVFLSPAFATASHPGAPALGPLRLGRLIRALRPPARQLAALGGIDGTSVRRLPCAITAVGAIGALI